MCFIYIIYILILCQLENKNYLFMLEPLRTAVSCYRMFTLLSKRFHSCHTVLKQYLRIA